MVWNGEVRCSVVRQLSGGSSASMGETKKTWAGVGNLNTAWPEWAAWHYIYSRQRASSNGRSAFRVIDGTGRSVVMFR